MSIKIRKKTNKKQQQQQQKKTMANTVDPDDIAYYEPSHLDLHCLHRYPFWVYQAERVNTSM